MLKRLKEQRAQKIKDAEALLSNEESTDEDLEQAQALMDEADALEAKIKSLEQVQARAATARADLDRIESMNTGAANHQVALDITSPAQPVDKDLGLQGGGLISCVALGAIQGQRPVDVAIARYGERHPVTNMLTAGSNQDGGITIPENVHREIIGPFFANSVFGDQAPVPLSNGNATFIKGLNQVEFGFTAENEDAPELDADLGFLSLTEKEVSGILPLSNTLLRNSGSAVEMYCRDLMGRSYMDFRDKSCLLNKGAGKQLTGILHQVPKDNVVSLAAKTSPTVAEVDAGARKLITPLVLKNVPLSSAFWVMSEGTRLYLADLRDGNGNLVYPGLNGDNPIWKGFPVKTTTNVAPPGDVEDSIIALIAMDYVLIGDSLQAAISASKEASFKSGGNLVSAFSRGLTLLKLEGAFDAGLLFDYSVAVARNVQWGG